MPLSSGGRSVSLVVSSPPRTDGTSPPSPSSSSSPAEPRSGVDESSLAIAEMPQGLTAQTNRPSVSSIQIRSVDAATARLAPAAGSATGPSISEPDRQSRRTICDGDRRTRAAASPAIASRSAPSMSRPSIVDDCSTPRSPTHHSSSSAPIQPQLAFGPDSCTTTSLGATPGGRSTHSPRPNRARDRSTSTTIGVPPTSENRAFDSPVARLCRFVVVMRDKRPAAIVQIAPSGAICVDGPAPPASMSNGTASPPGGSSNAWALAGSTATMPAWLTPTIAVGSATSPSDCGGPSRRADASTARVVAVDRSTTTTPLALCATSSAPPSAGASSRASALPEKPSASTTRGPWNVSCTNQRVARGTVASIAVNPSARNATMSPVSPTTTAASARSTRCHGTPVVVTVSVCHRPSQLPDHAT